MSVYINASESVEDVQDVRYLPEWSDRPTVAFRFGRTDIYIDAEMARKLADDILAALPEQVTA